MPEMVLMAYPIKFTWILYSPRGSRITLNEPRSSVMLPLTTLEFLSRMPTAAYSIGVPVTLSSKIPVMEPETPAEGRPSC